MKRIIMFILCLAIAVITVGQDKKKYPNEIEGVRVSPPRFIGSEKLPAMLNTKEEFSTLGEFMSMYIQYPEKAKDRFQEGTEVIQFNVSPSGELADFKIINSITPEIDAEVIRVLKKTDRMWNPGTNNGVPVAMEKEFSISFKLPYGASDLTTDFTAEAQSYFKKGNKKFFIKDNNKSALRFYDKAMQYLPNDKALLVTRGMCRYELGDNNGACRDWNRIKTLGGYEGDAYLNNFCDYKGYADLISILQKK
ncbi:MAG: energy transducer TonB [Prolixibacteraceae bacterium]|nr:energy transducer TonB [Prolixibacteraceae bacterium]